MTILHDCPVCGSRCGLTQQGNIRRHASVIPLSDPRAKWCPGGSKKPTPGEGVCVDSGLKRRLCQCDPCVQLRSVPKARGERSGRAKLKVDDVRAILASQESTSGLARRYGVAHFTIYLVRKRRTWKHVTNTEATHETIHQRITHPDAEDLAP